MLQGEKRDNPSLNNTTDLERVATVKRTLNAEKIRTLFIEYIIGPEQVPWYLKTVIE